MLTQVASRRCFTDRLTEAVRVKRLSEPRFNNLIHTGILEDAQFQEFLAQDSVAEQVELIPMDTSFALCFRSLRSRTNAYQSAQLQREW